MKRTLVSKWPPFASSRNGTSMWSWDFILSQDSVLCPAAFLEVMRHPQDLSSLNWLPSARPLGSVHLWFSACEECFLTLISKPDWLTFFDHFEHCWWRGHHDYIFAVLIAEVHHERSVPQVKTLSSFQKLLEYSLECCDPSYPISILNVLLV